MTAPGVVALRLQVGARTLATIPHRLIFLALSLDAALAGAAPTLDGQEDYLVTSLPVATPLAATGHAVLVRQRYPRHWTDLTIGHDAWRARLSANARSSLSRKGRRLAAASAVEIRRYARPDELAAFHRLARPLAARTYQERLLGTALPDTPAFLAAMHRAAAADAVRAWLLLVEARPIAYLYAAAEGSALRYDHVGYDPAWNALSPGTVLHAQAMADLFAERRFARFDFTEGDGQHKRLFATDHIDCHDLLMLRPGIRNRATLALLGGWDGGIALAKRSDRLRRLARGFGRG